MGQPLAAPPRPEGYVVPLPKKDRYDPNGRLWPLLKAFLWLYRMLCIGRVHIIGRENIPDRPVIVVSNHAFVSDAFVVALTFKRVQSLAQAEALTIPFFGWLLARGGQIPVVRGQRAEIMGRAADAVRRGWHILVYPEGQLSHGDLGGGLHEGRTGAAQLSATTGAPLVPVGFYVPTRYGRVFRSEHYNRQTVGVWQIGGPCYMSIGEPWWPFPQGEVPAAEELRAATDEAMSRIGIELERAKALAS